MFVQTAAVGTGTAAAKDDHKHNAVVASPVALTGVAADGTATSLVRSDHKHAIGPMAAALDMNKQAVQNEQIHQLASAPGTPVKGQLYYNTADDHVYICTVA